MSDSTHDPSPSGEQSDALRLHEPQPAERSSITERVLAALVAMNSSGDDAEELYQESLQALRRDAAQAIIVMARLECELPRHDYAGRWAIVYLVGALEHRLGLPLLRELVLTPIPPEQSRDPHSSTVAEETIIRTTAVDAVSELARKGDEEATQALLDFLAVPSFSVRRAAIQALRATPRGDDIVDRIRACLPNDQEFLLDLKPLDVQKAEQIDDPTRHLSEGAKAEDKPSAPDITDRSPQNRSLFVRRRDATLFRAPEPETPVDDAPTTRDSERED